MNLNEIDRYVVSVITGWRDYPEKNKNMAAISCQSPVCPLIFANHCIRSTDFLRNQMGKLKSATSTITQVQYKDMDKELCYRWTTVPGKRGRYLLIRFYYC